MTHSTVNTTTPAALPEPGFRSSAVARMAGMPVSTLRIWEQRYQAVAPGTSPTGHRLYSMADVQRVVLLRQLTGNGHAIGSLAGLDMAQLQEVAAAHPPHRQPQVLPSGTAAPRAHLRVVVVGPAMAHRLQRLAPQHRDVPLQVVAVFGTPAEAARSAATAPVDLLLWQTAGLQVDALADLRATRAAWAPSAVAVAYRFASAAAREALARIGAVVAREPADDDALAAWLASLPAPPHHGAHAPTTAQVQAGTGQPWLPAALGDTRMPVPAPRFDDATLTAFAGLDNGVACDCPTHVAELLMQITAFETYSADCTHRSAADAQLHAHLQRVAAAARVLFENALARVAQAEGWALPEPHVHPTQGAMP